MRTTVSIAVACLIVGVSVAADAEATIRRPTSISGPSLDSALQTLARDRDLQIVYPYELVGERQTAGVTGDLTFEEALTKLLAGTELNYRYLDDKTVTIVPIASSGPAASDLPARGTSTASDTAANADAAKGDEKPTFWARFRVAQADTRSSGVAGSSTNSSGQAPNDAVQLAEVLVTAQKREERLIDVPISIVAITEEELKSRNITGIDELSLAVPGLAVVSDGGSQRRISLRGISNTFGKSSLIGLYLDEASATTARADIQLDLRTYDLERVEVLRGPQGTLYGEGSVGGTIRFITRNPELDRFGMTANLAALFTEHGAPGQRIETAVNVPLIEDELGLRIAGTFDQQGGWIDQPAADRDDFNDQNLVNVRVKGLWQPTSQFTVNAMAVIHRNDAPVSVGEDDEGNYTQVFGQTTTPHVQDDYTLYNLTLTYDLRAVRVLSTTSYIEQDKRTHNLGSRLPFVEPPFPRFDFYSPFFQQSSHILTEELRLASTGSAPWQWTIGGFYRHAPLKEFNPARYLDLPGPLPATPAPAFASSSSSESWAVFGETSYALTERFTLGAGLRYFEDEQEDRLAGITTKFDAVNPRVYAQFKLATGINTYVSAAKGFRSGGFNSPSTLPTYDPESVWTYELGTKISVPGGALSVDMAVFHSNYEDYQIVGVLPPPAPAFGITSNAGDAKIKGIEAGMTWRPTDRWTLGLSGNYVKSEFVEISAAASSYEVGDPLDVFPEYGFTVLAQHDFSWAGKEGRARLNYNQQGHSTYRNRNIFGPSPWYFSQSDIIDMLDCSMSVQWSKSLSFGIFAQNLLDDRGFVTPFSIEDGAARARPRTYGIQFSATFD